MTAITQQGKFTGVKNSNAPCKSVQVVELPRAYYPVCARVECLTESPYILETLFFSTAVVHVLSVAGISMREHHFQGGNGILSY